MAATHSSMGTSTAELQATLPQKGSEEAAELHAILPQSGAEEAAAVRLEDGILQQVDLGQLQEVGEVVETHVKGDVLHLLYRQQGFLGDHPRDVPGAVVPNREESQARSTVSGDAV